MNTLGLVGKSLIHSFSKSYFENKFTKENILDFQYLNFEIDHISNLHEVIKKHRPIGFNVTIPYKESIIPLLDEIEASAKEVGAVNTVLVTYVGDDYSLKGYNTDVFGFAQSIKPFFESHHEKALILGTGGASKAVAYVLENLGVSTMFATRNKEKLTHNVIAYQDINEHVMEFFPLIVNTTPLGTFPNVNDFPELPYEFFSPQHLAVDLIYNPAETLFLQKAKSQGAKTLNGLSMLHQQAEKAWELFVHNI